MRVRPVFMFAHPNCADVELTVEDTPDGGFVIQIEQEDGRVWIPVEHAESFAGALKAYAKEQQA